MVDFPCRTSTSTTTSIIFPAMGSVLQMLRHAQVEAENVAGFLLPKIMSKIHKLPAMQFYVGDWRKDPGVQALGFHERGVWFEMICLMHESEQRGKLMLNGLAMPDDALARLLGLDKQILTTTITTLLTYGVASKCDETGALMCRRMIRDENLRKVRAECGKQGGNPALVNQKSTTKVKQKSTPSSSISSSISTSSVLELSEDNSYGKSDLLLRAEKLMNRRASTKMSKAEMRAYKDALSIIKETTEDDWQALESFYASDAEYKRQGFATLLNNWNGEIEKAKAYKQKSVAKPWRKGECQEDNLTIPF